MYFGTLCTLLRDNLQFNVTLIELTNHNKK